MRYAVWVGCIGCDKDSTRPVFCLRSRCTIRSVALLAMAAIALMGGPLWAQAPQPQAAPQNVTPEQQQMIDQLNAIGYLPGTERPPAKTGVTVYRKGEAYDGLNLYVAGHAPEATLMDMRGRVLHTWRCEYNTAWPARAIPDQGYGYLNWRRAYLYENGDLLAVFEGVGLVKLDKDSKLLWVYLGNSHHDLDVLENGDIYVLSRKAHMIPRINKEKPVLEDFITLLDPQGHPKRELSLLEAAERSEYWPIIWGLMHKDGDLFHSNTLKYLDGSMAGVSPLYKKGNILTSLRRINAIAIIDMEAGKLAWCKFGPWVAQHQPVLMKNGDMMLFDNNRFSDYSRVVEFEPFTEKIVWYYLGNPPNSFYSCACGSCQPLPNNNVLIVESQDGRAFEVKRDGTIVWDFTNPHIVGDDKKLIAYLFDLVRLRPDFPIGWTQAQSKQARP